jgi:hypothetical protein
MMARAYLSLGSSDTHAHIHNTHSHTHTYTTHTHTESVPLLGVLDEQAGEQCLGILGQGAWELDLLQQDELKQHVVVAVIEGQAAAHHLVHDHARAPPVHRPPVVIVLQHLQWANIGIGLDWIG